MCSYLDKVGSIYYFRRAVPEELRPFILTKTGKPRTEWKVSLRTKDRDDAKKQIPAHTIETDEIMASAREMLARGPTPARDHVEPYAMTEEQIEQAEWYARQSAESEARLAKMDDAIEFIEAQIKGSTRETPPSLRAFRAMIKEARFDRDIARSHLAALKAERAATASVDVTPPPTPSPAPAAKSALPLLATFDSYAKARGVSANIAKDWRRNLESLVAYLGHDDLTCLSTDEVMGWRDRLLSEMTKRGTQRTPRTVKGGYLTPLTAMLGWLVSERKLPSNVAAGINVPTRKAMKLREREFTADEATAILRASLIPAPERTAETGKRARRWIPWLCA